MQVKQIYELTNSIAKEVLGAEALVTEDLSNVVDMGTQVLNAGAMDSYVKSLVNHIGRVIFVNRSYSGRVPSILMDGWEYGSVLEKITAEIPEADENDSWNLVDGTSYDQDVFKAPKVSAKFYNSKSTFEVTQSFTEMQVKQSFSNAGQLNAFMSMLYDAVDKAMTIRIDGLTMRTINNMTGITLQGGTSPRYVKLLTMYNNEYGTTLTANKCLTDMGFLRYASYIISTYVERVRSISTMFNAGGKARFTPSDRLHLVMLDVFGLASEFFLQSDTYHNTLVQLPRYETVSYWQGSGTGYTFDAITSIDLKVKTSETDTGTAVSKSGVLGVLFDRDALGVCNLDRRVTTHVNARAEFYNNWFKFDAGYFNDTNENFVVFMAE